MQVEFDALIRNQTWTLVPYDPSKNVVDFKCLFRIKHSPNGSVNRYKAHLVAPGFTQQPGLDFHSTFNPVVKTTRCDWSFPSQLNIIGPFIT